MRKTSLFKKGPQLDVLALLEEGCSRNTVIELHHRQVKTVIPAARGRMLALHDNSLLVDTPQTIGRKSRLCRGTQLDGFFAPSGTMLHFSTIVLQTNAAIRLNKQKIIHGVRLSIPKVVEQGQRRDIYRTSLVCDEPTRMSLRPVSSIDPIQCPIDQPPLDGIIIDASAQGFGVNIPHVYSRQFHQYDAFFITFLLPDTDDAMTFLVEVRQIREIPLIDVVRLGLLILPWPTQRELTRSVQPLLKNLNEIERARRRSA